ATYINQDNSLENYPIQVPRADGYYAPFAHPVGFMMLLSLSLAVSDAEHNLILVKLIAPYYLFCILLLFFVYAQQWRFATGLFAALLFVCIPMHIGLSSITHIDMI